MPNTYSGIYEALVHDLSDPQGQGRARLRIPSVLGQAMSAWARPALGKTDHVPASIGDRVWAMFEHGDLGRPVWFSPVQPLFNKSNPPVEQLHANPSFDLTSLSTLGNANTGTVASRPMPNDWTWGWSFPTDTQDYPTLISDATVTRSGVGRSLKTTWGTGGVGPNQYVWSSPFAAPADAVIKVSAWLNTSAAHMTAEVGIISANDPQPSVFTPGYSVQTTGQRTSPDGFTKVNYTAVLPAGHTHARVYFVLSNNSLGPGSVWLDDTESELDISGGVGTGVEAITINFTTAATLWTLNHNLGEQYVDVRTMDNAGNKIVGDIDFVDENTATVGWYHPTSGVARITTG